MLECNSLNHSLRPRACLYRTYIQCIGIIVTGSVFGQARLTTHIQETNTRTRGQRLCDRLGRCIQRPIIVMSQRPTSPVEKIDQINRTQSNKWPDGVQSIPYEFDGSEGLSLRVLTTPVSISNRQIPPSSEVKYKTESGLAVGDR